MDVTLTEVTGELYIRKPDGARWRYSGLTDITVIARQRAVPACEAHVRIKTTSVPDAFDWSPTAPKMTVGEVVLDSFKVAGYVTDIRETIAGGEAETTLTISSPDWLMAQHKTDKNFEHAFTDRFVGTWIRRLLEYFKNPNADDSMPFERPFNPPYTITGAATVASPPVAPNMKAGSSMLDIINAIASLADLFVTYSGTVNTVALVKHRDNTRPIHDLTFAAGATSASKELNYDEWGDKVGMEILPAGSWGETIYKVIPQGQPYRTEARKILELSTNARNSDAVLARARDREYLVIVETPLYTAAQIGDPAATDYGTGYVAGITHSYATARSQFTIDLASTSARWQPATGTWQGASTTWGMTL